MTGKLYIFHEQALVGTLTDEEGLTLTFSEGCIRGSTENPLRSIIPVSEHSLSGPTVLSYFENLLPEGAQRSAIEKRYQVSTVFGLLQALSGETIGCLTFSQAERLIQGTYTATTWDKAMESMAQINSEESRSGLQSNMISGAQAKILIHVDPKTGTPLLPAAGAPSSHILKPDIVHPTAKVWSSSINETLVMILGGLCKLGVARTLYKAQAKSCLIERFDRELDDHGQWRRFHQTDFCQELGITSDRKYEKEGGPGFVTCYNLVKQKSTAPAVDCLRLLNWLFFNLYTGNHDSHAKNLSFLYKGNTVRLSPFYDLMCTSIYTGLTRSFAFDLGGSYMPGEFGASHMEKLAEQLEVSAHSLSKAAQGTANLVLKQLPQALEAVSAQVPQKDRTMLDRIGQEIRTNTQKISQRLTANSTQRK